MAIKSKFAHVKRFRATSRKPLRLSLPRRRRPSRKKEKKEKAKGGGSNAEEKVYPLFGDCLAGSSERQVTRCGGLRLPLTYWPIGRAVRGGNGGFGLARCQSCPQSSGSPRPRRQPGFNAQDRRLLAQAWNSSTLLDTGATCGSLPEWLFAEVYEQVAADVAKRASTGGATAACPIREIGDFFTKNHGRSYCWGSRKARRLLHASTSILRIVLTPVGKGGPQTIVRLKVMPADSAGFPDVVLGLPSYRVQTGFSIE